MENPRTGHPGPPRPGADESSLGLAPTVSRRQLVFTSWMADVLTYIVVLNLFVEFNPDKVIDSFAISILTAVLLKGMLDVIYAAKKRVLAWSGRHQGKVYKVLGVLGVWAILFFSKFAILEGVIFVFRDHVQLGDVADVFLLVLGLMLARGALRAVYLRLA